MNNLDMIAAAWEPEGAIAVIKSLLLRPHSRGNGKSTMTAMVDAALGRAILALEKEVLEKRSQDG